MIARAVAIGSLLLAPQFIGAQGVTTAAVHGLVSTIDGAPAVNVAVYLTNGSTGRRWITMTLATGHYLFEDVTIGGPYRLEARALGFRPEGVEGIQLGLGQRARLDLVLTHAVVALGPVTVTVEDGRTRMSDRAGPADVIDASTMRRLPNPGRDFLSLAARSPLAALSPSSVTAPTGGVIIAGQNRAFNGFQIDGTQHQDQYRGRLPGRESLPRPISLEAIQEIQVLAAPFDVRHGAFAGGLVNAVTRSGTNTMHGSLFAQLADALLVGRSANGQRVAEFTTTQFGATLGGPIVRDRLHFFLSADVQRRSVPDPGPLIADTAGDADNARIGISYESAQRFQDILGATYGLDAGSLGASRGTVPAHDLFAKLTVQPGANQHVDVSHHYAQGTRAGFIGRSRGVYVLTSLGRQEPSTSQATRLAWTSLIGRWSNELLVGSHVFRDRCVPNAAYPFITVDLRGPPDVQGVIQAGRPNICPSTFEQKGLDVTDNVTVGWRDHVITLGTRVEFLRFSDDLLQGGGGFWNFASLDSLDAGVAYHYDRALPGPGRGRGVRFRARHVGVYAQNRWSPGPRFTITAGLRIDAAFHPDRIPTNVALDTLLGHDTGRVPGGIWLWSPRLGFSHDSRGDGLDRFRGGIGLFAGAPPASWVASAYRDDGTRELFLACNGAQQVPAFDPVDQPETCTSGPPPRARLSFFDPSVRPPQTLKISFGADRRLPANIDASVDVIWHRSKVDFYVNDVNLLPADAVAAGEANRPLYGTIDANGVARADLRSASFRQVVRMSNGSGDRASTVAASLRRVFRADLETGAWYSFTRARDRMSLVNFPARANLENPPLDGTHEARRRGNSYFEIPHRVMVHAVVPLPSQSRLALVYSGTSGTPFTYVIDGDANADGIGSGLIWNDPAYVPRDSTDISLEDAGQWEGLDAFIRSERCLRSQRGYLVARNSCRNPWFGTVNARLTKRLVGFESSGMFELTADLYNVLNLVNRRWGQRRVTSANPSIGLLDLTGWDTTRNRGEYAVTPPARRQVQDLASRWQMELSLRYTF